MELFRGTFCSLREAKNDPEDGSEIFSSTAFPVPKRGGHATLASISQEAASQSLVDNIPSDRVWGEASAPLSLESRASNQRGLFLSLKIQLICLARICTCLEVITLFFLPTSPFYENVYPVFLIIKFWKHITYLVL
jgi:hypothetical protein